MIPSVGRARPKTRKASKLEISICNRKSRVCRDRVELALDSGPHVVDRGTQTSSAAVSTTTVTEAAASAAASASGGETTASTAITAAASTSGSEAACASRSESHCIERP